MAGWEIKGKTNDLREMLGCHVLFEQLQCTNQESYSAGYWKDKHHSCKRYSLKWCLDDGVGESSQFKIISMLIKQFSELLSPVDVDSHLGWALPFLIISFNLLLSCKSLLFKLAPFIKAFKMNSGVLWSILFNYLT